MLARAHLGRPAAAAGTSRVRVVVEYSRGNSACQQWPTACCMRAYTHLGHANKAVLGVAVAHDLNGVLLGVDRVEPALQATT
jgi:hypothetical protein